MSRNDPSEMTDGHRLGVDVSDEDWRHAQQIYSEIESKPGSERIATEFALAHLSGILTTRRPRTVLELGAGIGTITKLLATHPHRPRIIVATEDNEFCIGACKNNLGEHHLNLVTLVTDLDELLAQDRMYDLAICDGGFDNKAQFQGVSQDTTFFFEGHRGRHRKLLREYLTEYGLSYTEHNYPRSGIKFLFKKKPHRYRGALIIEPKIKRRKGFWIGTATLDPHG